MTEDLTRAGKHCGCNAYYKFTLIELLVVIAIIAVLAGMLLPALSNVKDKVTTLTCVSNMKQVGQVLHSYANDFNDSLPKFHRDWNESNVPAYPIWMGRRKMLTKQMVTCTAVHPTTGKIDWRDPAKTTYVHVGLNSQLYIDYKKPKKMLGNFKKPSHLLLFGEDAWDHNSSLSNKFTGNCYFIPKGGMGRLVTRHNRWRSMNVGFVDGHVITATFHAPMTGDNQEMVTWSNYFGGKLGRFYE